MITEEYYEMADGFICRCIAVENFLNREEDEA